eukprot:scaffold87295_cov61-Phaeocystis_antarctica.AAC.3
MRPHSLCLSFECSPVRASSCYPPFLEGVALQDDLLLPSLLAYLLCPTDVGSRAAQSCRPSRGAGGGVLDVREELDGGALRRPHRAVALSRAVANGTLGVLAATYLLAAGLAVAVALARLLTVSENLFLLVIDLADRLVRE